MPASTPLGFRYPLSSEAPAGHTNMQTLATDVDTYLRFPRARYYFSGASASRTSGVYQPIGTLTAAFSLNGVTNPSSTRIQVPLAGIYAVSAHVQFAGAASGFGNRRGCMIRTGAAGDPAAGSNLGAVIVPAIQANLPQDIAVSTMYALAANAYVEWFSFHDAAAAINLNGGSIAVTWIELFYIAPST